MHPINPTQRGLARGREAGAKAKNLPEAMREAFRFWRVLYPTAADIGFTAAVRDLDRERLACEADYGKFPELRGHADLLRAERTGFRETSGLDETFTAFHYSADFFMRRRLDARHLARWDLMPAPGTACTGVYFSQGLEGVTMGRNYDVPLRTDMTELAVRRPTVNGACAATACAYLPPKRSAHQLSRARKAMEMKGETEATSVDLNFHIGAGKRYRRLLEPVEAEAKRGATLWGTLDLISDHAVPYPDRICLAGESSFPDREKLTNWTVSHHASVVTGPNRRCLYRSVQSFHHAELVYEYTPNLMLGPGAAMQPGWQEEVSAGRCILAPPGK